MIKCFSHLKFLPYLDWDTISHSDVVVAVTEAAQEPYCTQWGQGQSKIALDYHDEWAWPTSLITSLWLWKGARGLEKVGSDHSMDSCHISTQGNSASTDSIHEAMEPTPTLEQTLLNIFTLHCPKHVFLSLLVEQELINCSWHQKNEFSNSPIHEFNVLHKSQRVF